MRRYLALISLLLILGIGTLASAQTGRPVQTVPVERGEIFQEWIFAGNVKARAEVSVAPEIGGRIVEVLVDKGDPVKRGDVLAKLDTVKLELAVRRAEAALAAARANYEHTRQTAEELVRLQLAQAQAAVSMAETALAQMKDLAYVRTQSQKDQAEAGLAALQATLRKIKEGARKQEIKQVEAMVEQAKAGLENARRNLERVRKLHDQDAASDQALEGIETQYRVAEAQYQAALEQLDLVKEGARPEDIEAMEAQLRQAEAGMRVVETLINTKSWEKDIARVEAQVEQARAGLRSAEIQVESKVWELQIAVAKSQLDQAQVALELAQRQLEDATVRAPVDGLVSARMAEVGNFAAPGIPLFTLVDLSERRVAIEVSESDLASLSVGQSVRVRLSGRELEIPGRIDRISPTVDPDTHNGTVRVVLETTDANVRPGMYAEVRLRPTRKADALVIPRSAVLGISNGQPYVFVVEGGQAKRREVKLGVSQGDRVEVVEGLREGEAVVVSGQFSLSDGTAIRVVNP